MKSDPAASTDLVRLFNRRFPIAISLNRDTYYPQTLYHYTGAAAVAGILLSRTLWATNFSFLNDPTEVEYGRNLVLDLLKQATQDGSQSDDRKTLLAAIEKSFLEKAVSEVYVCCFTECRDDLSQWRAYGTATGARYCLGFCTEALMDSRESELRFEKITYERRKQCDPILEVIEKAIDFVTEMRLSHLEALEIADASARRLARLLPQMKSPAYAAEKEWRIIRWIPGTDVSEVCFDATRGVVRPYVKFPLTQEKQKQQLPVDELLVLAPGRELPSLKAADMLLRKAGITGVQSVPSQVPFAE
jgi:hypothetical protein